MKLLFSYFVVVLVAIGLGAGGAYLTHQYQLSKQPEFFYDNQWIVSDTSELSSEAFFEYDEYNFGEVDPGRTYTHDFVVRSVGDLDLEIWFEGDLSEPFQVDLSEERVTVPAKESYPITVRFDAGAIEGEFEQQIKVRTNESDGAVRTLTIRGKKADD